MMEALGEEAPPMFVESLVTEESIVKALRDMLPQMNADTATLKVVMQKLAIRFDMEFVDIKAQWRPRIKALLPDMLELCPGGDNSENESDNAEAHSQKEDEEEEEESGDFRPSRKRSTHKLNAVVDASDEEGDADEADGSDVNESRPEDSDGTGSDDEVEVAPVRKKRATPDKTSSKKRKIKESAPPVKKVKTFKQVDPPGLASLKELGRAAGVLNPQVYKLLKSAESTDEAEDILRERLQDAGVSFSGSYPTSRDISAAKRKHDKDKELEGIDTSLIITGGRSRRGSGQRISYKEDRISGEEDNAEEEESDGDIEDAPSESDDASEASF
ncbi:hypothetical protein GN244_ATG00428 [Phytophthora infestans]|uniref:DEK C-terminal domain-containing protein n=1 Tax=Phytophthora infestans TaxID=4787 RepID=A0A833TN64_PHYIN|nr:hypothetical protein GN244_ATG00428 [Phytophthora infestans]